MLFRPFSVLLMLGSFVVANAQSSWKAAADSSAMLFKTGNTANAYESGLRAAVISKPATEADSVWSAVLQIARRLPDSVAVSTLLRAGKYYFDQNETDKARNYLNEAINEGKRLNLPPYYLRGYVLSAKIEVRNSAQDKAALLYKRVLRDTSKHCPDCRIEALLGLTDTYLATSRLDSATLTAQQALTTLQRLSSFRKSTYYPLIRTQLGRCAYLVGNLTKAIQETEEAYSVAKVIMPNSPYLIAIGHFYTQIISDVNDDKALEATRTARRVLERQPNHGKNPYYILLLDNEIGILRTLERNEESVLLADSVFQRHSMDELLQLYGSDAFLSQVSRTYIKAGRNVDVERIAKKAQELVTKEGNGGADPTFLYRILGRYNQYKRNFTEAVRCFKEETRLDSLANGVSYINHSLKNRLAVCQAEAGQRADAYASFSRLVQEFDDNARTNLWLMSDTERDNYVQTTVIGGLSWYLLRRPNPKPDEVELAYNYKLVQQGVRLKMNRTINRFMHTHNQADSSLKTIRQLIGVRARLADRSLTTNLTDQRQLQQTADSLERIMGNGAIAINQSAKTVKWQDVRAKLKPEEAAIEIIWYTNFSLNGQQADSNAYTALLLRPEWLTPKLVHLPLPEEEHEDHTDQAVAYSRTADYYLNVVYSAKNQKVLYEQFWQPIATALGPAKRIYVALDGGYQKLSLSTLRNPKTSKYLLEELDIVLLNSTQDILEEPRMSSSRVAELIGHPTYSLVNKPTKNKIAAYRRNPRIRMRNGLSFNELPYTKVEVEQLDKLLKTFKLQSRVRMDTAASEAAFQRLRSPKIVHVATHGYRRDTSRNVSSQLLTCGLVLAGAADTILQKGRTDGILTGYEASLLNLHDTELVALSACESGVGDYYEGEGVHGLQRAFLLAGAQSVLMSLWKVNDQLTQQLMTDFYRYWLSGLSKPQALRRAQLNLRKQHLEPYYWGAFVLLGQ